MKKAKKILALLLCAALLVGATVAGTVAYLTDKEDVVNTFTVGNIDIKLDEADVDGNGRTEVGNAYHLLPNQTYTKDPTVWVKEGSEEAYIRLIVKVANYDNMLLAFTSNAEYDDSYIVEDASTVLGTGSTGRMVVLDNLVDRNAGAWECVKFTEETAANTGTYVFNYYPGAYTATADDNDGVDEYDELPALFTTITVPWQIDNEHLAYLNNTTITVTAEAIQAAGFNSVEEAWAAFPANPPTTP